MVGVAMLFPGQGAQYTGMGKSLWESHDSVKQLFRAASEICEQDMKRLLFEGTEEELKQTVNTQIAVTLVNASVREILAEKGIASSMSAGFSLGEMTAVYDAGVVSFESLMSAVKARAEAFDQCIRSFVGVSGGPAMAAVIGLDFDTVTRTISDSTDVFAANDNGPKQVVISGLADAVERVKADLTQAGARRVIPLKVSGPFHTPLMADAAAVFKEALAQIQFAPFMKPCYSNVTGLPYTSASEIPELLLKQLVSPVRWTKIMEHVGKNEGQYALQAAVESGPGTVLTGLWKNSSSQMPCYPADTLADIEAVKEKLKLH